VWAEQVRAFINLEACGSGGRELVFQTGPGHPWLIKAYAAAAPHPFASVIGQELFQSGVIPADTDFRIFRDYGNIPGLDIAYMKNGYVYHTVHDTEDRIPGGSVQRAGDNLLAVVRAIAQAEVLGHTDHESKGGVVFFDFLGLFLIHYPEWCGILLNLAVVTAALCGTVSKVRHSYNYGVSSLVYLRQLGATALAQLAGCLASLVLVTFIAVLMDALGRPMSWYAKPWLIAPLYMAPTLMAVIAVFHFVVPNQKKSFQFVDGIWVIEALYFEVSKLFWCLFTLIMTFARLKSSFFCMIWVLFPSLGRALLDRLYAERSPAQRRQKDNWWLLLHLLSLLLPLVLNMYLIFTTFTMFIPIMARAGSSLNPDLIIGYKAAGMTLATLSFICPLAIEMNKPGHVITALYIVTFSTMVAALCTQFGFPYSNTPSNLAPHRALLIHTDRQFYNLAGQLEDQDSGYFIVNLDRNSPKVLHGWVPELAKAKEITPRACEANLYCGMPVYYPAASLLRLNHWLPGPRPKLWTPLSIELAATEAPSVSVRRLLFRAVGPDHMGVFLSPATGVSLARWSLAGGEVLAGPEWKRGRPTHYIFHSSGKEGDSWEFWLELEVPRSHYDGNQLLDLAITGHHLHGSQVQMSQIRFLCHKYRFHMSQIPFSNVTNTIFKT
jgi:hypothetical protein